MSDATAPADVVRPSSADAVELLAGDIWRVQISTASDTILPRDRMVITPHFQNNGGTATPKQLADALGANMLTYLKSSYDVRVAVYLEDFAAPGTSHIPLYSGQYGSAGNTITSQSPREVALCLSYYAGFNVKRFRGRLYIPHNWLYRNQTSPSPAPRVPAGVDIAAAANIYTQVIKPACVTAAGVQWVVASRMDKNAKVASQWWVDNEWDTVRRRGGKADSRTTGAVT